MAEDQSTTTDPAIRVSDVVREYRRPRTSLLRPSDPVHALRGVSFEVAAGERFGIVGESGCGKSTLLRILSGLDRPTSGTVEVEGTDISRLRDRQLKFLRGRLQLVFQDPMSSLDPRMRVRDIVAEPLTAQGLGADQGRIAELLEAVGLGADAAARYPHQFSGGQRQRISIARALAPRPQILVADEPVSALDVSVRAQVLNLIADLVEEHLDVGRILEIATAVEGHPDNAAPAIFGGLTVSLSAPVKSWQVPVRTLETVTVLVPSFRLDTEVARGLIPAGIDHAIAADNSARAGLLVHGLSNDAQVLFEATRDQLHQEFRRSAYPDSMALVDSLRAEGLPAVISGAGPTVLVLAEDVPETLVPAGFVAQRTAIDLGGYRVSRED